MISADSVVASLAAIAAAGGDPSKPTQIIDQTSGQVVAIAHRDELGQTVYDVPNAPTSSVAGVVQTVTGWIDNLAGTITNIGTQLARTGNAIQGAAAGAQAGYNAPTTATPYLIGIIGLLGVLLLVEKRR